MNRQRLVARIQELREEYKATPIEDTERRGKIAALGKMAATLKDVLYPEPKSRSTSEEQSPATGQQDAPDTTFTQAVEIFGGADKEVKRE